MEARRMNFLTFPTPEAAIAADARAFAFLKAEDGARGGSWSGVFVDYGATPRYAILFDPCIAGAVTEEELGAADESGNRANVVAGEMIVRDANGQFVSGNWDRYVPPALPKEVLP
jgi:hypothetical protein